MGWSRTVRSVKIYVLYIVPSTQVFILVLYPGDEVNHIGDFVEPLKCIVTNEVVGFK